MTLVDVCPGCGTMFEGGEDHCRRCGADRSTAVQRELRDLCHTYTGEDVGDAELERMVKPMFEPTWGKVQWYELPERERRKAMRGVGEGSGGDDEEAKEG